MAGIKDYSTVPKLTSNTHLNGISTAEGMLPSNSKQCNQSIDEEH